MIGKGISLCWLQFLFMEISTAKLFSHQLIHLAMNHRNLFFLIVWGGLMNSFFGQDYQVTERNPGLPGAHFEATLSMISTSDYGFLMAGFWGDSAFLMKYNCFAEQQWFQTYHIGTGKSEFRDVVETQSGEFVSIGSCENCMSGDSTMKIWVARFDDEGNMLHDTIYGMANKPATAKAIIQTADAGFVIAGNTLRGGWAGTSSHILKLDQNLNQIWLKYYDGSYFDDANDVVELPGGGYMLSGSAHTFGPPKNIQIFRTDSSGTALWSKTILHNQPIGEHELARTMALTPNGNVVIGGNIYVDSLMGQDLFVLEIQPSNGTIVDSTFFGSNGNDYVSSIQSLPNGQYLIAGKWGEPLDTLFGLGSFVIRLNQNYDTLETIKTGGFLFSQLLSDVVSLSDDGQEYAFAGSKVFFGLQNMYFHMRKEKGRCGAVDFKEIPRYLRLYPRNLTTNTGAIIVDGEVDESKANYNSLKVDVYKDDILYTHFTQSLVYSNGKAPFNISVDVPAGLFEYRIEVFGVELNGVTDTKFLITTEDRIVVGDAFIIQGQSNALAGKVDSLESAAENHNPFIRVYGNGSSNPNSVLLNDNWYIANGDGYAETNGNTGQWGIRLANQVVTSHQMPVAILNGAHGGRPIAFFQRNDGNHEDITTNYGRLLYRGNQSGLRDSIRAIFWYQGESDSHEGGPSLATYKDDFLSIKADWNENYSSVDQFYLFQIRRGCFTPLDSNLKIMEAQRQLAQDIPDLQIMSTTASVQHSDNCHFPYHDGYKIFGDRIYRLVARDIYNEPFNNTIEAPQITEAYFSSPTQIVAKVANAGSIINWELGAEQDFRLEKTTQSIDSVYTKGDSIIFNISGSSSGPIGLSYFGHTGDTGPWVTDELGIGLICFLDLPVKPMNITSIRSEKIPRFTIYPNPTLQKITIERINQEYNFQRTKITLLNLHGQSVLQGIFEGNKIILDLQSLPAGVYFTKIESGGKTIIKRILKE